jgi:hypothetical protein
VAELADCRAVVGTKPWKKPRMPRSRKIRALPCRKPRMRGWGDLRSSILDVGGKKGGLVCSALVRGRLCWGIGRGLDREGRGCALPLQLRFYAFKWRDCQQGFRDTGSETGDDGSWAGDLAIRIFEEGFVGVECDEACTPIALVLYFFPSSPAFLALGIARRDRT